MPPIVKKAFTCKHRYTNCDLSQLTRGSEVSNPTFRQKNIRSVRLDEDQLEQILEKIIEAMGTAANDKHGAKRFVYRAKSCIVYMQQPGELESTSYSVPTYSISEHTLGFLHGGYVHIGTKCMTQLTTLHGAWQNVPGSVVRCSLAERGLHDVEIEYDQAIQPADFVASAQRPKVLLVDDDPSTSRLSAFHLEKLNAIIDQVESGEEAVTKAMENEYDVILMDMEMPGMNGFEATRELRKKSYTRLIVATTALTGEENRQKCLDAGCDRYLPKPLTREDLDRMVESLQREPLLSEFYNDPTMHELINSFLSELPAQIKQLGQLLEAKDWEELAISARRLKANGSGHGFGPISDAAVLIEKAATEKTALNEMPILLSKLRDVCSLARQSSPATH